MHRENESVVLHCGRFLTSPLTINKNLSVALNLNKDLKTYYSIKEVSEMFGLTPSTLRYWEKEFPHLKPHTNSGNTRQYTKNDIEELRVIYNLVKVRGFKLAAARKMMHANRAGTDKSAKIIENLMDVRDQLMELKAALDTIR